MESLQIRTGEIRLMILDDAGEERGVFKFNPEDIKSAQAVFELQAELPAKEKEYEEKQKLATTEKEQIDLLNELVDYFEGAIDRCFGEGTSELVFGKAKTLSMFFDFFEGIAPYYEKASKARVAKYKKKSGK